jgi:hypothetical protein
MLKLAAIRDGRWKLISENGTLELYDWRADPGERRDLLADAAASHSPEVREAADRLRAAMEQRIAADRETHARFAAGVERRRLDSKTVEQMRALGYID